MIATLSFSVAAAGKELFKTGQIYKKMLPVRLDQLTGQVGGVAEGRITATARLLGRGSGPRRGGGLQRKRFVNKVEIGFVLAAFYLESE